MCPGFVKSSNWNCRQLNRDWRFKYTLLGISRMGPAISRYLATQYSVSLPLDALLLFIHHHFGLRHCIHFADDLHRHRFLLLITTRHTHLPHTSPNLLESPICPQSDESTRLTHLDLPPQLSFVAALHLLIPSNPIGLSPFVHDSTALSLEPHTRHHGRYG